MISTIGSIESRHDVELNVSMGFSAADFAECGPVLFGHGVDPARVRAAVQQLHPDVCVTRRADWQTDLLAPDAAVERAIGLALECDAPALVADTQDHPGAGGDANTTGLLHALLRADPGDLRWP